MTTAPVSSSSSSSAASSTSNPATASLAGNYSSFLSLLTTELQNQDPTAPMDTSQYTNQLVLFSQVEQQIDTNTALGTLNSGMQTEEMASAAGLIGGTVATTSSSFALTSGDSAQLTYTLPEAATYAQVNVSDDTNTVVASLSGLTASGSNTITWNGENSSGTALPTGTYTFQVVAQDGAGSSITATTQSSGTVSGVAANSSGVPEIIVNGIDIPLSQVTSVSAASAGSGSQ